MILCGANAGQNLKKEVIIQGIDKGGVKAICSHGRGIQNFLDQEIVI